MARWVKKMGIDKNIAVIKLSEPTFLRTLENAIRYGQAVLLENVLRRALARTVAIHKLPGTQYRKRFQLCSLGDFGWALGTFWCISAKRNYFHFLVCI